MSDALDKLLQEGLPADRQATSSDVPNAFPKITPGEKRLAVIGDAPGEDEVTAGSPFVGTSGRLLRAILAGTGIACDQVFFGNVCQRRPERGDGESLDFNGADVQSGLERLGKDLSEFRPNCVLLLGKLALRAFRPDLCYPSKKGYVVPLGDWRGSILLASPTFGYKCVATYHPSYILRAYSDMPYFKFDVARAVSQSRFPDIRSQARGGNLRPILPDVLDFIARIRREVIAVTWDIEGYADDVGITMLSLCTDPFSGIVIPFWLDGQNYWTEEDEVAIWQALAGLMADPHVRKKAHNFFYELFVSAWRHRMVVNNAYEDTMMKHWEYFPEAAGDGDADDNPNAKKRQGIGRSLADCCSIYTEQPYYKGDRLSDSSEVKLRYNLTDSQVTDETDLVLEKRLAQFPASLAHYRFNINLIPALNYVMLRGCRFNVQKARELATDVQREIDELTTAIDDQVLTDAILADVVTRKRKSDPYHFNVDSGNQLRWLLFTHLKYKPLKKNVTATGKDGTSEDVLLHYWTKEQHPLLRLVIRCVRKRTRLSDITKLLPNADGRIRSSFDPVGTNTGRLSSRKSNALELHDGEWIHTGTNLQNVTKDLRICFTPDTLDQDFWQFDLAGADAWTVAADLAALGHPAMLDDMLNGIKPALVLYYMLQEKAAGRDPGLVNRLDRPTLKLELKRVKQEIDALDGQTDAQGRPLDWQYLCCKRCQHGTNYDMRPDKLAEVIFGDSDGNIALSHREAEQYQYLYRLRYKPEARQTRIARELRDKGYLVAACGIRRQFFKVRNRMPTDSDIREASAFEPQANTTWATNKALERLWYDPENRTSRGGLFIEPLLQVHDAIAGQYRSRDRDWAGGKLRGWFDNPLVICGTRIVIPADGKYGTDWKNCKTSITL
jgi:uracil-DNA glycosylase